MIMDFRLINGMINDGISPEVQRKDIHIVNGKIAEIADRVGSIEVGKDADFVITDKSILDCSSEIKMVYVDGRQVI